MTRRTGSEATRRYLVSGVRLPPGHSGEELVRRAAGRMGVEPSAIREWRVLRRSLDARGRREPCCEYTLGVELREGAVPSSGAPVSPWREPRAALRKPKTPAGRPLVVGAGPAGLFAALRLCEYGLAPLILERGKPVEERTRDVGAYWRTASPDPDSNVQFGEGGAGTFSDGKLTSRSKDFRKGWVLERLVEAGAPDAILYEAKPHLGTDRLRGVVRGLRRMLLDRGAAYRFGFRVRDLTLRGGAAVGVSGPGGGEEGAPVFLACGHSARDLLAALERQGVALSPKGSALGVRAEVLQEEVNLRQYGRFAGHPALPPAEFALAEKTSGGRGVYSFCMCPGGTVIPAGVEADGLVINGMSGGRRSGRHANAALVVEARAEDYGPGGPLGGFAFQREWERKACALAGPRAVPAASVASFLKGSALGGVGGSSCPWPLAGANLALCLPGFAAEALREALPAMIAKLPPLAGGTLLAVETRTSSPVRIERGEDMQSVSTPGLYPVGEGAGYAGGIVSSAIDGVRAADAYAARLGGGVELGEDA